MDATAGHDLGRWHDDGGARPPAPGPDVDALRALAEAYGRRRPPAALEALPGLFRAAPRLLTRLLEAEAEVRRLRAQVGGHAARIAARAELPARRAERGTPP